MQGLTKRFGAVEALRGVSFTAYGGQITGLIGCNGAGKSTTLRILSTVLGADGGWARVGGINVADSPQAVRAQIGVLPHGAGLYGNLSARENVAYYAALQGLRGSALHAAVEQALERLGVDPFADRRAKGFSQGERTRVALARALVHHPKTLIMDEPTNGLDIIATRVLHDVVRNRRDEGCCVLFSSHVMSEVEALCDRVAIIAEGRIVLEGSAAEIRRATGLGNLEDVFLAAIGGAAPATAP